MADQEWTAVVFPTWKMATSDNGAPVILRSEITYLVRPATAGEIADTPGIQSVIRHGGGMFVFEHPVRESVEEIVAASRAKEAPNAD